MNSWQLKILFVVFVMSINVPAFANFAARDIYAPVGNVTVTGTNVLFDWQGANSGCYWWFQVSDNPNFTPASSNVIDTTVDYFAATCLSGFSYGGTYYCNEMTKQLTIPANNTAHAKQFYWRVAGTNDNNFTNDKWSPVGGFLQAPSLPTAPTLGAPINEANVKGIAVTFSWNAVGNATDYYLEIYNKNNALLLGKWVGNVSSYKPLVTFADDGSMYHWRVKAKNDGGEGSFSSYGYFVNGKALIAAAPELSSPLNRSFLPANDGNLIFQWSQVANAESYEFQIISSQDLTTFTNTPTTTNSLTVAQSSLNAMQKYYWQVRAINYHGPGPFSDSSELIIGASAECWPEVGTGTGQSHIDTCYDLNSNPEIYRLKDISRRTEINTDGHNGAMDSTAAIITQVGSVAAGPLTSGINSWTEGGNQKKAIDAHVNSGLVYDYFLDPRLYPNAATPPPYGRNSFDGVGGTMVNIVANSANFCGGNSACFNPTDKTVNFDPGSTDSGALDIVTHEWTHGITSTSSGLKYEKESGALDEAFSDWMAIAHKQARGSTSWEFIEGGNVPLRNLADPTLSNPPQPVIYKKNSTWTNIYKGTPDWGETDNCTPHPADNYDPLDNDRCYVHKNAGVLNRMFYLLANGGSNYEVTLPPGIGITRAMEIALLSNTVKWKPSTASFTSAMAGMLSAAGDLSATTNELNQLKNAWAAVGVGDLAAITTVVSPGPQAGTAVAYHGSRPPACTSDHDACIADHRYKSFCCSYDTDRNIWGGESSVAAMPAKGYRFDKWTEDGQPDNKQPIYKLAVTGDRTLTANFIPITTEEFGNITVNATSPPHTISIMNSYKPIIYFGTAQLSGNNTADFTIVADTCSGTSLNMGSACDITVSFAPKAVGAKAATLDMAATSSGQTVFTESYPLSGTGVVTSVSLSSSSTLGGTVKLQGNQLWGATVTAVATPNSGYSFTGWRENGTLVSSAASYTFTVTGSRALIAGFSASKPAIGVSPASGNFMTTTMSTPSPLRTMTISNTGASSLSLTSIVISGANQADFVIATSSCGQTLAPSSSCALQVRFSPQAPGSRGATLAIASNDPVTPSFVIPLAGFAGTPVMTEAYGGVFPSYYTTVNTAYTSAVDGQEIKLWATDFSESINLTRPIAVTLRGGFDANFAQQTGKSTLTGSLTISSGSVVVDGLQLGGSSYQSSLTIAGNYAGAGTITSFPAGINCPGSCTATFASGETITLSASPRAGMVFTGWSGNNCSGNCNCTLVLNNNATVTAGFAVPVIAVSSQTESFGNQVIGSATPERLISVSNTGTQPLVIGTVALNGTNPQDFTITANGCSQQTVAPSATCSVKVKFSPASAGTRTASLSIASNDPVTPTLNVHLDGNGIWPTLTVSRNGTGSCIVTSSPSGISCGFNGSCSHMFAPGTSVTLTAEGGFTSYLAGWTDNGVPMGGSDYHFVMTADRQVTATCNLMYSVATGAVSQLATPLNRTIFIDSPSVVTGTLGEPLKVQAVASSGTGKAFGWTITEGKLPPGLNLDKDTGVISGIPSASGYFPVTIQLTDSTGDVAEKRLPIFISDIREEWHKTYGGNQRSQDYATTGIATDWYGNVLITGVNANDTSSDMVTIKYDHAGNQAWVNEERGWAGKGISVDAEGGVYVAGTHVNETESVLHKYAYDGSMLWSQTCSSFLVDFIRIDGTRNICLAGRKNENSSVLQYDNLGNKNKLVIFNDVLGQAKGMAEDKAGNIYVTSVEVSNNADIVTRKISPEGTTIWQTIHDNGEDETPDNLAIDDHGAIYVSGHAGSKNGILIKYDGTDGKPLGQTTFGWQGYEQGRGLAVADDGAVYVSGSYHQNASEQNAILTKINNSGTLEWVKLFDSGIQRSHFAGIALDKQGNIFATGWEGSFSEPGTGLLTVKYLKIGKTPKNNEPNSINSP